MDITTNAEVAIAIGTVSTMVISLLKSVVPKTYIKPLSKIVPALFSLMAAFMANYGLEAQLMDFVTMGTGAYILSQTVYKLHKD